MDILKNPPARLTPTDLESRKWVVSYSDGEGNDGGVGVAMWTSQRKEPYAGVLHVPLEVRRLWDKQRSLDRWNDIFEIVGVGPLGPTGKLSRGTGGFFLWLHFIDNAAALSSLINGSSSVREGDVIVGETWSRIQGLGVFPWWDRVDTSSNPVDGLSRGILSGPWA